MPLGEFAKCVLFRRETDRQTDRENGHYENIYYTRRARSGIFFHGSISFVKTVTLFYWSVALKGRFETAYVVSITRFYVLRARGAHEAGFFFMDQFHLSRQLPYFIGM